VSSAIPFLDLPVQGFVLGSGAGMLAALVNYNRTGDTEQWPLFVAYGALAGLFLGLIVALLKEVT